MPYRPPPPDAERCTYALVYKGRSMFAHRCERRAVFVRDGKGYCRQHDPITIKVKRDAKNAEWQAAREEERAERDRTRHRLATWEALYAACNAALAAISENDAYLYKAATQQLEVAIKAAEEEVQS